MAMPQRSVVKLTKELVSSQNSNRKDKPGLEEALQFFIFSHRTRQIFVCALITITVLLPLIYLIDFSRLDLPTLINKGTFLYVSLIVIAVLSLSSEKLVSDKSDKSWPLNFKI